jgi:phage tail sheath protein FI
MAERLHPGVYVEERRRGLTAIQGVSTSNYGTVGFTPKGPVNVATLAINFDQAESTFGTFTEKGQVMTQLFAFFANKGVRAYIVRVVASDAEKALSPYTETHPPTDMDPRRGSAIGNPVSEEVIDTGDGATKAISGILTELPCRPGSVSITYKEAGTPVVAENTNASPAPNAVAVDFTGRIAGTVSPTDGPPIVPGTVILTTTVAAAPVTYTDPTKDGLLKDGGGQVRGYIDYKTGHYNLSVGTAAPDAASTITAGYTPVGTEQTVVDDGAGNLTGATLAAAGTIDYETGAVAFTIAAASAAPHDQNPIQAAYTQNAFHADPVSAGEWGNGLQFFTRGNEDYYARATASFSKHDVLIYLDGALKETFQSVQFTDPTAADYVATVVNEPLVGSKLLDIVEPSNADNKPSNLDGKQRTRAVAAGNGVATQFGSTGTADPDGYPDIPVGVRSLALETPIQPTSVQISFTDAAGVARVITDDGNGNLIGDVDPAAPVGFNRIDYTSGKFAFKTVAAVSAAETSHATPPTAPVPGSLVGAQHYLEPGATSNTDDFYGGYDGVAAIGRNQLTDPSLKTAREGVYALLTTDELLNIAIPDAAGDVTMAVDQVTEAETNGKWFIILASPPGMSPQQVKDWRRNTLGITSSYAALYYPYITIADPVTDLSLNIPPQGHIAGVYARTDATKSVGKAPAGTVDGRLDWTIGLERKLEFTEIDTFFQSQVNALIDTPQTGRVVWGARTLESPPDDFRYVHVRRLFNFLKASIYNSTHGFVFENVGAVLRGRIQLSVESFMLGLFNQGLFAGRKPQEGFQVICDETNNPKEVEEAGEVICDVYAAPNKPGEFIVFRIQQKFVGT